MHNLYFERKSSPKLHVISVVFQNVPKVNNHPLGEWRKFAQSGHPAFKVHLRQVSLVAFIAFLDGHAVSAVYLFLIEKISFSLKTDIIHFVSQKKTTTIIVLIH
jgi:hypothetical protein